MSLSANYSEGFAVEECICRANEPVSFGGVVPPITVDTASEMSSCHDAARRSGCDVLARRPGERSIRTRSRAGSTDAPVTVDERVELQFPLGTSPTQSRSRRRAPVRSFGVVEPIPAIVCPPFSLVVVDTLAKRLAGRFAPRSASRTTAGRESTASRCVSAGRRKPTLPRRRRTTPAHRWLLRRRLPSFVSCVI